MTSPHEAVIARSRDLLAQADRAVATQTPAGRDAAISHTDAAVALLGGPSASGDPDVVRMLAAAWVKRGHVLELMGTPASLEDARRSHEQAVRLFRDLRGEASPQIKRDLALALINRGNVLGRLTGQENSRTGVKCYDEAIEILQTLAVESIPAARQTLAATWLNRGDLILRTGGPAADAHQSARKGLELAGDASDGDLGVTGLGMQARHLLVRAIAAGLQTGTIGEAAARDLFAEATDAVDEGMQLARRLIAANQQRYFAHSIELFRFGGLFYLQYQPHFLAEYLLETLDPEKSGDAATGLTPLHAVADEIIKLALAHFEKPVVRSREGPALDRATQTLHDLRAAAARLAELRSHAQSK